MQAAEQLSQLHDVEIDKVTLQFKHIVERNGVPIKDTTGMRNKCNFDQFNYYQEGNKSSRPNSSTFIQGSEIAMEDCSDEEDVESVILKDSCFAQFWNIPPDFDKVSLAIMSHDYELKCVCIDILTRKCSLFNTG